MSPNSSDIRHLSRPDAWASDLKLRVDGRPFTLEGREYVSQVMRDTSQKIVVKKAAQTAFTISFLVVTFHRIVLRRWHHLYLLPLKQGAIPFVQKRVDPIIDSNPILKSHFAAVDNRLHKQTTDDISMLIRGVNIESELQETPTDCIVFDEFDRMATDFLEDAKHRADGSSVKKITYLSTPSVPGHGIDSEDMWHSSDMHLWEVPCPGCGRFQALNFSDHVKIGENENDCTVECEHCSRPFTDLERAGLNSQGRWVPHNLTGSFRGYSVNQLNSPTVTIADIMDGFFRGQTDAKVLKSHFNQARGEPYTAPGNQFTPEILDKCRDAVTLGGIPPGAVFLGIDVGHDDIYVRGKYLSRQGALVEWNMWHFKDRPGVSAWTQLEEKVLHKLTSWICVCDAHPDKRAARALSLKYPGKFFLGFEKDRPETDEIAKYEKVKYGEATSVIIDRTMAFDELIHRALIGKYVLPMNARELLSEMPRRDYNDLYHHMIQMVRVEEEDTRGRIVARWIKNKNPDHWHHADMFALIASFRKPRLSVPASVHKAVENAGALAGG